MQVNAPLTENRDLKILDAAALKNAVTSERAWVVTATFSREKQTLIESYSGYDKAISARKAKQTFSDITVKHAFARLHVLFTLWYISEKSSIKFKLFCLDIYFLFFL